MENLKLLGYFTCNRWIRSSICFSASSCFPRFFIALGRIEGLDPGRGWIRTGSLGSSSCRLGFKSPLCPLTFLSSGTLDCKILDNNKMKRLLDVERRIIYLLVNAVVYWVFDWWNPNRSTTNLCRHVVMRSVGRMGAGRLLGIWPTTQEHYLIFNFATWRTPHVTSPVLLIIDNYFLPPPSRSFKKKSLIFVLFFCSNEETYLPC